MAKEKETHIIVDPEAKSLREKFQQMLQAYQELEKQLQAAFSGTGTAGAIQNLTNFGRYTEKFAGQLTYLRLSLGKLKAAFSDAFAPIGAYVLPVINRAIHRLTSFLHTVGAVLSAVMDSVSGTQALSAGADAAAKSYQNLGSAARRSLAGFDQLQRLNGGSSSWQAPERTRNPSPGRILRKLIGRNPG